MPIFSSTFRPSFTIDKNENNANYCENDYKKICGGSSRLLLFYLIAPSIIDGIETKLAWILPFSWDSLV